MKSLNEYYRQNPQKDGHVDIIFVPYFAKKYVHFDRIIFYENQIQTIDRGGHGWGQSSIHSLDRISAVKYIISEDKKVFRKSWCGTGFEDKRLRREDYHHCRELFSFRNIYKVHSVLLTCNESEINLTADVPCLYVNRVAVWCPPYLCPTTGILWDYQDEAARDGMFSERFWLFKRLPKTRVKMRDGGGFDVKRGVAIETLGEECDAWDPKIFFSRSNTAFLSGTELIRHRLGISPWSIANGNLVRDSREFLLKPPKTPKFTLVRSAARYLRKRLRISPLRPSEKKFFQMMGALAHINNETLSRKKVYAA